MLLSTDFLILKALRDFVDRDNVNRKSEDTWMIQGPKSILLDVYEEIVSINQPLELNPEVCCILHKFNAFFKD